MSKPAHHGRLLPTTHWSELILAQDQDPDRRRAGLEQVLRRYQPALLSYLRFLRRLPPDKVEDLVQGFIADRIIQGQLLDSVDRDRGRFRSYLLHVFDNYVANIFRTERTQRRGGSTTQIDITRVDPPALRAHDQFEIAWAQELLKETLRRMEDECRAGGRARLWALFDARVVQPGLNNEPPMEYAVLVERFGFESPSQAFNALATAKRMFERILKQVLVEYAPNGDPDEELRSFQTILSAMRA